MGVGACHTIANRKRNFGGNFLSLLNWINTSADQYASAKGVKFRLNFLEAD